MHRKIVWQSQITYLETFRRFIWLLRKAQFSGYCASIILLLLISQLFMYRKSTNYFTNGNRLHNCLLCIENLCENLNSPIWKRINDLYGYCGKSTNFWLLRIYHFGTAHLSIIYQLQIDHLHHHWKSSKHLFTLLWKIVWQFHIAYLETFRRFIWLLRKTQFLGYCASIILQLRIHQLFLNCKTTNYVTTGNRQHNCLLWREKLYDNNKSPIWKHFEHLYGYCAKPNFLATAHNTIL